MAKESTKNWKMACIYFQVSNYVSDISDVNVLTVHTLSSLKLRAPELHS